MTPNISSSKTSSCISNINQRSLILRGTYKDQHANFLKNNCLIAKINDCTEIFIDKNNDASACRNFVKMVLSMIFISLYRLQAINIKPATALALFKPFLEMMWSKLDCRLMVPYRCSTID